MSDYGPVFYFHIPQEYQADIEKAGYYYWMSASDGIGIIPLIDSDYDILLVSTNTADPQKEKEFMEFLTSFKKTTWLDKLRHVLR